MGRLRGIAVDGPGTARPQAQSGSHRAVWPRLALCFCLSVSAVAARDVETLLVVTAVDAALLLASGVGLRAALAGAKALAVQSVLITALYLVRYGVEGVPDGLRISWQLYMAFLPGVLFVQTTPGHSLNAALERVLPYRTAFVLSVSVGAIPRLVREITAIYHTQALRGARILPRDIIRPASWPDFVHCLIVPAVVKVMSLADDTALAAKARDFGAMEKRTSWPGPDLRDGQ